MSGTFEMVLDTAIEYSEINKCDVVVLYSQRHSSITRCEKPPFGYTELYVWQGYAIYIIKEQYAEVIA